jgi:hypothetical protein
MNTSGLKAPTNVTIDFAPSERQYELWKLLQPDYCPHCGGHIVQKYTGTDRNGNPQYKPFCDSCGESNLPQLILGGGAAGGGKMLTFGSSICTPTGFKKLEDIKVGDLISNPITGGAQEVVWLHPIETHNFYRIHFIDGTHIDCSEGHLWSVHQAGKRTKRINEIGERINERIKPTKWMFDWMQKHKAGKYNGRSLIIPLTSPVKFAISNAVSRHNIIEPYILGALLGDGCISSNVITLTSMDQEIVDKFSKYGYDMTCYHQKKNNKAKQYTIKSEKLLKGLIKLNLLNHTAIDKFIPNLYKYSTVEERIALMQGLMDTDGYVDDRGHLSYSTISKQLAEDVAFVVRSLGGVATIKKNPAGYKKDTGEYIQCNDVYDVYIRTKIDPELCGIIRKKQRARHEFNGGASELGKRIIDIEYIGKREGRCITVDDPSGLYIVDDFTVTHNSYVGSCWLISSCMRFENIRAVVARKTLKALKESTWNTIKMVVKDWGLVEGVNYKINNLEGTMTFWNDSVIIMKEMTDLPSDPNYERFGSSEYTIAFVDECSEISERAIEVLLSRLRWRVHETFKVPRMLMSTNPCITWVRSRFVQDDDGNPTVCKEGEFYIPFSVFDNPNEKFRQVYESALNKITDKATRERLLYGNWDFVDSNDMAAYWNFNGEKHLVTGLKEKVYNPLKPIICSWDFNVSPFMSTLSFQIDYEQKKVYVLEENLGKPKEKENNTPALSKKISKKYLAEQHIGGLIITGDPAGLARSTQTEDGVNNYTIIIDNLSETLRPKLKLLNKQPPQTTRLEFVNNIFTGYDGWEILIDMRCRRLAEDLTYQTKNSDGTKCKKKVLDPNTQVKYEKYGHLSDCLDYFLCKFLDNSWDRFQRRSQTIETTDLPTYGSFNY